MQKKNSVYSLEEQEAFWWLRTMNYVRTIPGTVYSEQLTELSDCFDCPKELSEKLKKSNNILNDMNCMSDIVIKANLMEKYHGDFLKKNPVTNSVFTIQQSREILDSAIWNLYRTHKFPEQCLTYNKYLYNPLPNEKINSITDFDREMTEEYIKHLVENNFIVPDNISKQISFNFSALNTDSSDYIYVNSFNICRIMKFIKSHPAAVNSKNTDDYSVGSIYAKRTVFLGDTCFSLKSNITNRPLFTGTLCFNCATFESDVDFNYIDFSFDNVREDSAIDFRDACFHGNVIFRNTFFDSTSSKMQITFEDAKIYGRMEFNNVDLGELKINCFQTIFAQNEKNESETDSYKSRVIFLNTIFGGSSSIDFSDADFSSSGKSKICVKNILNLPSINFLFNAMEQNGKKICPQIYLLIDNCHIQNTLYIGNVSVLSFNHSQNYSRIVADDEWADMPVSSKSVRLKHFLGQDGSDTQPRIKTKGFVRTPIANKLLLAVYNNNQLSDFNNDKDTMNKAKGNDFLMLKENFASQGLYDDEDVAFILYMEYKPLIDSANKHTGKLKKAVDTILYKILYAAGKYGISPGRIIYAIFFTVIVFAFIFFIFLQCMGKDSFSSGNTLSQWSELYNEYLPFSRGDIFKTMCISFLYSLESVIPFVSQFEAVNLAVCVFTAFENFIGSFLIGYFSVAVVRRTLR